MKRSFVLIVVVGIMVVMITLGLVAMHLMTQQSRISEHKIRRMRAFYAAQAGVVHALERLRNSQNPNGTIYVGAGITGYPLSADGSFIEGMEVNINYNSSPSGPNGTYEVEATVSYSIPWVL